MRHFPTKDRGTSNNPPKLRTATLRMSLVYVDCGVSGKKFLWKALAFERKSIKIGLVKNGECYVQFMKDSFFSQFFVARSKDSAHPFSPESERSPLLLTAHRCWQAIADSHTPASGRNERSPLPLTARVLGKR